MNNKEEFPEFYPESLKPISWNLGEMAGPNKYFNKHLNSSAKSSKLFVKNVFETVFLEQGLEISKPINDLLQYLLKCFTIYFTEENGEFKISMKKDKDKNKIFSQNELYRLGDGLNFEPKQINQLVKHILTRTCEIYNGLIKRNRTILIT